MGFRVNDDKIAGAEDERQEEEGSGDLLGEYVWILLLEVSHIIMNNLNFICIHGTWCIISHFKH